MAISLLTEKDRKRKHEIAFALRHYGILHYRIITPLDYTCYLVIHSNGKAQITEMKEVDFSSNFNHNTLLTFQDNCVLLKLCKNGEIPNTARFIRGNFQWRYSLRLY